MSVFFCRCGSPLVCDPRLAGQELVCPACRQPVTMPAEPPPVRRNATAPGAAPAAANHRLFGGRGRLVIVALVAVAAIIAAAWYWRSTRERTEYSWYVGNRGAPVSFEAWPAIPIPEGGLIRYATTFRGELPIREERKMFLLHSGELPADVHPYMVQEGPLDRAGHRHGRWTVIEGSPDHPSIWYFWAWHGERVEADEWLRRPEEAN